jgi:hypothetical protein
MAGVYAGILAKSRGDGRFDERGNEFMTYWKIASGNHKPAAEGFLATGAPVPEGVTILGRWHALGSTQSWAPAQADSLDGLAEHAATWGNLRELQTTPVVEDGAAAAALAKVYGS